MIRAIRAGVGRGESAAILRAAAPVSVEVERKLFYPFRWFHLRCSTRTLLGESALGVSCLVDARRRLCATADPFELEEVTPTPEEVIEATLAELDGLRIAERYVAYAVRRRKAFVNHNLELLEKGLIYKPFWIVRCSDESARPFRVLVDGVTGGFCPIPEPAIT